MNKHSPTVPDIAVWPITSVLLLYGLIALGGLLNFPPFIDEGLHISYAQRVLFSGRVLAGASDSRLLVPLLLAPFAPVGAGQLFIGRVVTVLAGLISIALVYRLTRDLSNHAAARLAALFAVFCPYLLFYQRMVLIDSYTMMAGLLIVVLVYRSRDKRWREYGIACGVALAGAVAIKGTAIVFLAIPAIALLLDRRRGTRWLFVCYAVFGAIWIPLYLLLRSRGINYFGLAEAISGAQGAGAIFNRLLANIGAVWNIDAAYLSVPFLLVFILASVWWLIRAPRRAGLPILSLIIPTLGIIALSPLARARWLLPHVPLLIIAGMIGLEHLRQSLPAFWRRAIPALLLTGWIVGVFLPFYLPLRTNPALLPLSETDRQEYITADSAGFALGEVAGFLRQQSGVSPVVGMLANCVGLALYLPERLECPLITWDGSQQAAIARRVNELAQTGTVYIVLENLPYISATGITAPMQLLTTFERPGGTTKLMVYRIGAP